MSSSNNDESIIDFAINHTYGSFLALRKKLLNEAEIGLLSNKQLTDSTKKSDTVNEGLKVALDQEREVLDRILERLRPDPPGRGRWAKRVILRTFIEKEREAWNEAKTIVDNAAKYDKYFMRQQSSQS